MSEEEKEAIIKVRKLLFMFPESKELEILLNLIEKLQKENEELKAINSMQKYRIEVIDERELISKEKIKEKIKAQIEELKKEKQKIENKGTLMIDEEKGTISHYGVEGMIDVINLIVTRKEIAFFKKILNEEIK